jgi:hypothetical protein
MVGNNATIDIADPLLSFIDIGNNSSINMRNIDLTEHITQHDSGNDVAIGTSESTLFIDNMHSNTFQFYAVTGSTSSGGITVRNSTFTGPSLTGWRLIIDNCIFHNGRFIIYDSIQMTNSIVFNDSGSGYLDFTLDVSQLHHSELVHNTFAGNYTTNCPTNTGNILFDGNIFYNTTIQSSAFCEFKYNLTIPREDFGDTTNITGDPMFRDAANGDFHLKPGSAAIDTANPADVFTGHDLDGTPRPQGARSDIGAFEYFPPK